MTHPKRWTADQRRKLDADYYRTVRHIADLVPRRLDLVHLAAWLIMATGISTSTLPTLRAFLLAADPGNLEAESRAVVVALSVDRITATTDAEGRQGAIGPRWVRKSIAEILRGGIISAAHTARTFVLVHNTQHGNPGVERRFAVSRSGVDDRRTAVRRLLPDLLPNGNAAPWTSPGRMYAAMVANGHREEADAYLTQVSAWLRQRHRRDASEQAVGKRRHPPRPSGTRPADDAEHKAELARVRAAKNSRIDAKATAGSVHDRAGICVHDRAHIQCADQSKPENYSARSDSPLGGVVASGPGSRGPGAPAAARGHVNDSGASDEPSGPPADPAHVARMVSGWRDLKNADVDDVGVST